MKTFELVINEDSKSGVDYIALVDEPAIESNWEAFKKEELAETFNDYPEAASNNAQRAIDYKEENGSDCGTRVGWTRARQLANKENISWAGALQISSGEWRVLTDTNSIKMFLTQRVAGVLCGTLGEVLRVLIGLSLK